MGRARRAVATVAAVLIVLLLLAASVLAAGQRRFDAGVQRRRDVPGRLRMAVLWDLYDLVLDAAAEVGARPFLLYGTLLGWRREGRIIHWDYDLDFGIAAGEYTRLASAVRRAVARSDGRYTMRLEDTLISRMFAVVHAETLVSADVFSLAENRATGTVKRERVPQWILRRFMKERTPCQPRRVYYPLRVTSFLGRPVHVPNNPHAVLGSYYGPDYMTPDHSCADDCEVCVGPPAAAQN